MRKNDWVLDEDIQKKGKIWKKKAPTGETIYQHTHSRKPRGNSGYFSKEALCVLKNIATPQSTRRRLIELGDRHYAFPKRMVK